MRNVICFSLTTHLKVEQALEWDLNLTTTCRRSEAGQGVLWPCLQVGRCSAVIHSLTGPFADQLPLILDISAVIYTEFFQH